MELFISVDICPYLSIIIQETLKMSLIILYNLHFFRKLLNVRNK